MRVDFGPRFFNVTQWYRLNLNVDFIVGRKVHELLQ
jgi:hypothetical protein